MTRARNFFIFARGLFVSITMANVAILVSSVIAFVLILICCILDRPSSDTKLAGFWASSMGDLFEILETGRGGRYAVATASKFLDAKPGNVYPLDVWGCQAVAIKFPGGALRGHISSNRYLVWDAAATWTRQGV